LGGPPSTWSFHVAPTHDRAALGSWKAVHTPYTTNRDGRGPAWSNSLFEDNAEFGFGFRMALDAHVATACGLLHALAPQVGDGLVAAVLDADQASEAGIAEQRKRVEALRRQLAGIPAVEARRLETLADYLVKKSVWLVGGDGWAYDIGYGGLDHVLANRRDVNVLVLDTEVYSNTGGQQSKATPLGAAAKFAAAASRSARRISVFSRTCTDTSTSRAWRSARRWPRRRRRFSRRSRIPAPR
jgi:pyruvate-ferredoxin/flavodoxin oxidoreductase